ncbi:hypothetical protein [Metabacillus niabensis]|uniref:hypothetical protein n=1 Tax=Metabacillus niabensis TaxID=324854 RepID=UPI0039A24BFE
MGLVNERFEVDGESINQSLSMIELFLLEDNEFEAFLLNLKMSWGEYVNSL